MSRRVEEATAWIYRGIWAVLSNWFRVPPEPPSLPVGPAESIRSFRPAIGFLRYLKLKFWVALLIIDVAIVALWLVVLARAPLAGVILAPAAFAIAVIPDVIAYVAIHLRYDTTWYVLTGRSMRLRSGIWTIHETTITFENIQNVTVNSGPLERYFGIANVVVDTAGGGTSKDSEGEHAKNYHRAEIEGVENAAEIRNLILSRVRGSRSAGLGDETRTAGSGWSKEHLTALREIRDLLSPHPAARPPLKPDPAAGSSPH